MQALAGLVAHAHRRENRDWDARPRSILGSSLTFDEVEAPICLISERNQRHALSSRLEAGPAWVFGG